MESVELYKISQRQAESLQPVIIVTALGLVLSIAFYIFSNLFVSSVMRSEYTSMAKSSAAHVQNKLEMLRDETGSMASLVRIAWPKIADPYDLQKIIHETAVNIEYFDYVAWVYPLSEKTWAHHNLYMNAERGRTLSGRFGDTLTNIKNFALSKNIMGQPKASIFSHIPNFKSEHHDAASGVLFEHFSVMVPVEQGNQNAGFIVAMSNLGDILRHADFILAKSLSGLVVTDALTEQNIYSMGSGAASGLSLAQRGAY